MYRFMSCKRSHATEKWLSAIIIARLNLHTPLYTITVLKVRRDSEWARNKRLYFLRQVFIYKISTKRLNGRTQKIKKKKNWK